MVRGHQSTWGGVSEQVLVQTVRQEDSKDRVLCGRGSSASYLGQSLCSRRIQALVQAAGRVRFPVLDLQLAVALAEVA